MNPLNSIKMHLKEVENLFGEIKSPQTMSKALLLVDGFKMKFAGAIEGAVSMGEPAPSVIVAIPEAVAGANQGGEALPVSLQDKPVEAAVSAPVAVEMYRGNPVCIPVTDYEVTDKVVANVPPVEMRDGFPVKARVIVGSRCINPKLLAGKLEDGRQVSVERGFRNWKVGDVAECELARAGGSPLYRQVGTRT